MYRIGPPGRRGQRAGEFGQPASEELKIYVSWVGFKVFGVLGLGGLVSGFRGVGYVSWVGFTVCGLGFRGLGV